MSMPNRTKSSVPDLAQWMERDIQRRGLTAGDRYLTAEEAGQVLGVGTMISVISVRPTASS